MEYIFIFTALFMWFGLLGAESGASLPWSHKWQNAWGLKLGKVPEVLFALSAAGFAVYLRNINNVIDLQTNVYDFITYFILVFAFKEAATWAMLSSNYKNGYQKDDNNDGVVDYKDGRNSKIKTTVDDIAEALNVPITSPKYAWIWAALKGFGMSWCFGGTGAIPHAFGHWVAVKLFDKRPFSNGYKEWIGVGTCMAVSGTIAYWYFNL